MGIKQTIKNNNNDKRNMAMKKEVKGKMAKCPRCSYVWEYKGNRKPEMFIQCPACRISRQLKEFLENFKG